jgi:hypothetical protein
MLAKSTRTRQPLLSQGIGLFQIIIVILMIMLFYKLINDWPLDFLKPSECDKLMAPFKIEVELDISSGSECPMPEDLIKTSGKYVKGITLSSASKDSCVYTCRFRSEETKLAPYVINYRYNVDGAWTCKTEAGTTLPNKYRPLACKDS